ncbi:MAG: sensor histidine kinase [Saprospiraceae bacterium]|nr:sensor histidine kinase [Saprospiraceae bacterium]
MKIRHFLVAFLLCQLSSTTFSQAKYQIMLDSLARISDSLGQQAYADWDSAYVYTLTFTIDQMAYYQDGRASEYLDEFERYHENSNNRIVHGLYLRSKARVLDRSGKNSEALNYYLQAIDSLNKTSIAPGEKAMTLVYAAFLLNNSGSPEKCIDMLKQARPYAEEASDPLPLYYILDYMGDYNYYSGFQIEDYPAALDYYRQAEKLIEKHGLDNKRSDNYLGLADVYYRLKNYDNGDQYWNKADSIAREHNDYNALYGLYVDKSEIFLDQGRQDEAITLAEFAYDFAKKAGWPEITARAENQLYWTYRTVGDFEKALYYYEKYSTTQDSMNKQDLLNKYSELEAKYENEKKEQVIVELQNKNLRQTRNFLVGIILLSLLLLALGIWTILRLDRDNKLLIAKNKEILQAQIVGQTIERKRVASEIHDNLNTKVAAIRWQLQALEHSVDAKAKKILDSTLKLINDVYGDIRLISHNLMPEEIESIGLIETLSNLISQLNINNRVQFNLITGSESLELPPGLIYPIYNISFELINNILKHSQASNAWISIDNVDNHIVISVSDDGKGYNQASKPGGVGLKNIHSRVENLGGQIHIESKPNEGTKTVIRIAVN